MEADSLLIYTTANSICENWLKGEFSPLSANPVYERLLNLTIWIYSRMKLIRCYFNPIWTIYKLGFISLHFIAYFRGFHFNMDSYSKNYPVRAKQECDICLLSHSSKGYLCKASLRNSKKWHKCSFIFWEYGTKCQVITIYSLLSSAYSLVLSQTHLFGGWMYLVLD